VKLMEWANDIRAAVGLASDEATRSAERRKEARRDVTGRKVIVRQRKTLGILHLKNLSSRGGCGITDMPIAVGSLVFLELKKPHFFAAEVRWARNLSVGVEFFRPVRPDMLEKIHDAPADAAPRKRAGKH
jgi:hypothetical protein